MRQPLFHNSEKEKEKAMKDHIKEAMASGAIQHMAFIMDGNGRWATRQGKNRNEGHKKGAKVFEEVAEYCHDIGIRHVTVYAFSTENWRRPESEVSALLRLLSSYLDTAIKRFSEKKIRVVFLGDKGVFSQKLIEKMEKLEEITKEHTDVLNIAFNYGGRDEIVHACQKALALGEEISEESISKHLYTSASPDPDLIVRTAGEMRLSNFLLWQAAYAEFYYTNTLWPDMNAEEIDKACEAFLSRKRNFGALPTESQT